MLSSGRNRRLLPLVVATAISFLVLDTAGFGPVIAIRRTVLSVAQPIGSMLGFAAAPIEDAWHGAVHYDDVVEENRELRRRVAELEGASAGRADVEAELRALLDATEIDHLGDVDRVTARVVADRRTDVERTIEIDKGREDGIDAGMPVVTGRGLVGSVEVAAGDRSVIRLLTDPEMAVGVRSGQGLGLAVGTRGGLLDLQATPELAESIRLGVLDDGERFVTSGVDRSVYPPGIPVGTLVVSRVGVGPQGRRGAPAESPLSPAGPTLSADGEVDPAAQTGAAVVEVALEPLAQLDRLGFVTVLLIEPSR